jgi:hypothetical protein
MGRFIPRGIEPHGGCGKAVWPILLAFVFLLWAPVGSFAQSGDSTRAYYVPSRIFNIPFTPSENDPRIDFFLNVSTDGQPYRNVAAAKPQDRRFSFTAQGDGWYNFIVQTRDAGGVVTPADLRNAPPSIRVCVDTQRPVIELVEAVQGTGPEASLPTIHWKIVEKNLKEIWADYRATGSNDWVPLFLPVQEEGRHTWKPSWGGELEVRMQAVDKANLKSDVRYLRLRAADNVTRMPPPPETEAGKVMHVNNKTFQLHYTLDDKTVGPSRVASVDIWKLHPGPGQGWKKCQGEFKPNGSATVTVESSGRWGFRLIPRSGVGLAERDPQPGDAPNIWVEVDDMPPKVRVINVTVTPEPDGGGTLTVYWKADDTFLRSMPISIYLASPQLKDWKEIAKDLPNNGSWSQRTDKLNRDGYEFLLKVDAVDEAGNIGSDQWRDVVKVDLMIPRIKTIEVKPDGAARGDGQEALGTQRFLPSGLQPGGNLPQAPLSPPNAQPAGRQSPSSLNGTGQSFDKPVK